MEEKRVGVGVGVLILKDNKVLLGKRNQDPKKASSALKGEATWTMPGGKIRFGESFEETAKREVSEETGMQLNKARVICTNNDKIETAHFVTIGLLAEEFKGEPKAMEPEQITEWRWFPIDKLPTPLFFPSAKIIENYKRKEFYFLG